MGDDTVETTEEIVGIEAVSMPPVGLYVNVDVNDLTEAEVFELLGKLKDLFNA